MPNFVLIKWEKEGIFDGRKVFKALGNANLLGITRPTEFNGQGLDYSFSVAFIEEFAKTINCGGVMSGVVVQTDMAVPGKKNLKHDAVIGKNYRFLICFQLSPQQFWF